METKSTSISKKISALLILAVAVPVISLAQWSVPIILSPAAVSAGLNESMGSCIGTSGDTVHVVWTDKLSTTTAALYYARSSDTGLTWNTPVAITALGGNAWNPAIAVNGSNVHVVWREITPNNHRASYYKHSLDGGNTWGPNVFLDSSADWPAVSVSGNIVYMVNDSVTSQSPYNTEIFFMRSLNNGLTWSAKQQLTFAVGRSEDEAIHAEGSHIHMSWNDNRSGAFQILYKESNDYGVTWGPDVMIVPKTVYSTMVWSDGANVNVVSGANPTTSHYQIILSSSSDSGATWNLNTDLTNDTAHTYFYPDMVRDGSNLHVVCGSTVGAKYMHSSDGGTTWDPLYSFTGSSTFIAYSGCAVHIIYVDANKKINYLRNPVGNSGTTCQHTMGINEVAGSKNHLAVYPNPSKNNITITSETEIGLVIIYNSVGEVIYKEKINSTQQQIDIRKQAAGIYFLQANNTYTKLIKE